MRPLHLASLDKTRPVLVLTRDVVRPLLRNVTVAPVTSTVRGIAVEVVVGARNGLDRESVVNLDNVQTIPVTALGRQIGFLLDDQEVALRDALLAAYDLD